MTTPASSPTSAPGQNPASHRGNPGTAPQEAAPLPADTYVEIERVLLEPGGRAANLPADTAATPYVLRLNGFLVAPAAPGETATIRSLIGREHTGTLRGRAAGYHHSFGDPVPELIRVGLADLSDLAAGGPAREAR